MSLPKQDESVIKPLTGDSPLRKLGDQSSPLKPPPDPQTSQIVANKPEEIKENKEEEKLEQEEDEESRLLLDPSHLVTIKRSDYISPLELSFLQSKHMRSVEVSGFFGTKPGKVDKSILLRNDAGTTNTNITPVVQDKQTNPEYLKKDGIFLSGNERPEALININRLEQRLIWENKKEWFRKDNGGLIADTEFFEEKITTMRDVDMEKNPNLNTVRRNAYLSERQNQKKSQYYKLDILVGKLTFTNHPLFSTEDQLAVKLKTSLREYKERVDIALIPHLNKQLNELNQEYRRMSLQYDVLPKEAELIEKEIRNTQALLKKESEDLQELVEKIYKTWEDIKAQRVSNNYSSTTVRLNVRDYMSDEKTKELDLFLTHQDCSKVVNFSNQPIPAAERHRRQRVQQTRVFIRIYINDVYVARTRKQYIDWPSFEVTFLEKFQIYLFTKPDSIKFQIVMGTFRETTVDTIEIDIPGDTVNTLTSSSVIYREKEFAKKVAVNKPPAPKQNVPPPKANASPTKANPNQQTPDPAIKDPNNPQVAIPIGNNPQEPTLDAQAPGEKKDEIQKKPETEYKVTVSGLVNYKAEWYGFGPTLPPASIDRFGKSNIQGIKQKNIVDINIDKMIDLNDPRNEALLLKLREMKNKQMNDILKRDSMMPLADIESLRQKLYKIKYQKPELLKKKIPLTEEEIINNEELMRLIRDYEEEFKQYTEEGEYERGPILKSKVGDIDKFPESQETRKRIKNFRKRLFLRQQEAQRERIKELGSHLPLKAVVDEYYFQQGVNPIAVFFKQLFEQRGKLRPRKKAQEKVSAQRTSKTDILIHVVKGSNVPVRAKAATIVRALREGGLAPGFGGFRSSYPQGGFGGTGYNQSGYGPGYGTGMGQSQYGQTGYGQPGQTGFNQTGGLAQGGMNQTGMGAAYDPNTRTYLGRVDDTRMALGGGALREEIDVERVLPYVQVRLYDPDTEKSVIVKTETFEGVSPEWNDNLIIAYQALNQEAGFTLPELKNTRALLYFTLFDMVGNIQRSSDNTNKFSINIEKRYLGSFSIPLVTLFQNPKMEAQFKVDRPLFLFGYFNMKANIFDDDPSSRNDLTTNPFIPTHITLSISLNPVIELPYKNDADYYGGGEDPQLLLRGANYIRNLKSKNKFANRHIRLFAENLSKTAKIESKFIPRYLTPLKPPIEPIDNDSYIKAARFVSLIPFKNDTQLFKDLPDLWSTAQEFLDLKAGDYEEHAVLLCCYFMYIDEQLKKTSVKNYLVMGTGVPEGQTVYVLRRDASTNEVEIWNAVTGEPYYFKRILQYTDCCGLKLMKTSAIDRTVSDFVCPLQEIGCIANNENVWINLQDDVSPNTMLFDIENPKHWQPFLDQKSYKTFFPSGKIETIQTELIYEKTPIEFVQRLEKKVEAEIAKRIERERANLEQGKRAYRTKWDRGFGERIRNILLTSFESFKYRTRITGIKSSLDAAKNTEKAIMDVEKIKDDILDEVPAGGDIYGFPLNMPYTDLEKIWQEVKNTDIHNILSDDVEYVLSVAIYPYDSFVLSIWVYIAVIFNKPVK